MIFAHRLKHARAKDHIDALCRSLAAHSSSSAPSLLTRFDSSADSYVVEARLNDSPHEWSLIAGDALHNLRSALDSLAFALCERHSGPLSASDMMEVQYPICSSREHFLRQAQRRLAKADPLAIASIEKLQPFHPSHWTCGNPLLALQTLNNVDKHRRLLFVHAEIVQGSLSVFDRNNVAVLQDVPLRPGPFSNGQVVADFRLPADTFESSIHVNYSFGSNIVLSDSTLPNVPSVQGLFDIF